MGQTATDGAAITDLVVRDVRDRFPQQRMREIESLVIQDIAPAHQRTDRDTIGADLDLAETRQFAEIDQQRRPGDAERHHRYEALTAGERLCLSVMVGEQFDCFVDRRGTGIFEGWKLHKLRPFPTHRLG